MFVHGVSSPPLAIPAFAVTQASTTELIQQIEAIHEPPLSSTTDEAIASWERECDTVAQKKGALIWRLYTDYPSDSSVSKYLDIRWDGSVGHRKPCSLDRLDRIEKEAKEIAAKTSSTEIRAMAEFWFAKSRVWRAWHEMRDAKIKATDPKAKSFLTAGFGEADHFHKEFPKFDEAAYLYYDLSEMGAGTPFELRAMQTIATKYPGNRLAVSAKGRANALAGIGKPFSLHFNDVKTGKAIDLKDYRGKVVLLDFWATWCQPCRLEIEGDFLKKAKDWKNRGLEVIGVSLDVPKEKGGKKMLIDYIDAKSIPWPNLYDGKGQTGGYASQWGVFGIPAQFLIDKDGILRSIDARKDLDTLTGKYLK